MLAFGLLAIHFTPHRQLSNPVFLLRGNRMGDVAVMLSLTTNVIATSLIAIKALQHRRLLQEHLGEGYPSRTRVWRALALLVESGMIYCALLLAAVIDQIDQPTGPAGPTEPDSLFQNIITFFTYGCFVHIVAIYPVLIIVLVAMQRSPIDAGITQYLHLAADPSGTERNGERTSTLVFGPAEPGLSTFHNSMPDTIIELQARSKPQSDGQIEECATFDMGWDQGAAA